MTLLWFPVSKRMRDLRFRFYSMQGRIFGLAIPLLLILLIVTKQRFQDIFEAWTLKTGFLSKWDVAASTFMASYYLTKLGRNRLKKAIADYGFPTLSLTQKRKLIEQEMKLPYEGNISVPTLIRMETQHRRFAQRTVENLFRFLALSNDVIGDGLAYQESSITFAGAQWCDLEWIAASEKRYFGSDLQQQRKLLENWYQWNANGFWIFKEGEERIGSIVIMPIKSVACQQFQKGTLTESMIKARDVFKPKEKSQVVALYIESVIFHTVFDDQLRRAEETICANARSILSRSCDLDTLQELYALGASAYGLNLMQNSGFVPCPNQLDPRADKRRMYHIKTNRLLTNVENRRLRIAQIFERYWQ